MSDRLIPLTHPGEHLRELMQDSALTQYRLAKAIGVQQTRIMEILKGRRAITADTALRLARFFETTPQLWIDLQKNYDLEIAQRKSGKSIVKEISPLSAKARKAG